MNVKKIWYLIGALSLTITLVACSNQKEEAKAPETAVEHVQTAAAPQQNVQVRAAAANDASFSEAMMKEGHGMPQSGSDAAALMGSTKAIVPFSDIKVEKATGDNGFTVEEIYAKAAELNGKTIRVKGKVMKASPNIMGRNWIHIQDGTGNALQNTHDLVLTTGAMPEKGDVVTFEGKVSADKDFGAGYKYSAIVEDAVIAQ